MSTSIQKIVKISLEFPFNNFFYFILARRSMSVRWVERGDEGRVEGGTESGGIRAERGI